MRSNYDMKILEDVLFLFIYRRLKGVEGGTKDE